MFWIPNWPVETDCRFICLALVNSNSGCFIRKYLWLIFYWFLKLISFLCFWFTGPSVNLFSMKDQNSPHFSIKEKTIETKNNWDLNWVCLFLMFWIIVDLIVNILITHVLKIQNIHILGQQLSIITVECYTFYIKPVQLIFSASV